MNQNAARRARRACLAACSLAGSWLALPGHAGDHAAAPSTDDDVLAADRDFAALAFESGLRPAYERYLDTDAILFRPLPMPAREWLATHEPASGRLESTPALGRAACDGSLAITLGGWNYTPSDAKAESGQYLTAWRRSGAEGDWRIVLDQSGALVPMPQAIGTTPGHCPDAIREAGPRLQKTDRKWNKSLRWRAPDAAAGSRALEAETTGTVLGSAQADLALTHGQLVEAGGTRGAEPQVRAVYVRVWQRTRSTWQMLLELVTPVLP